MRKFTVYTDRKENIAGFIYIVIQMFLLPSVLQSINGTLSMPFSTGALNFIYFAINFICVTVIFRRYLLSSFKILIQSPFVTLRSALFGFVAYQAAKALITLVILLLSPNFTNLNDKAVQDSLTQNYTLMGIGTIILAPIAEEVLYRGVVFGCFHRKYPIFAYIFSTIVFSMIHIVGYIGAYTHTALLCSFILYLPAGLCLAWAYDKSGTIMAPILMHIAINQLGILNMR